jgi:hypothetical protein
MAQEQVPMALERVPVPAVFKRIVIQEQYSKSNKNYFWSI